ncbi:MAG: sulfatase-like hydrolase/transferase [Elusimicrobia bacterium]|nr:sulfatase-like hydrolase/transferase [Elusimicrobiota bacterium]
MTRWPGPRGSLVLLQRWVLASGRDVVATTRESILSVESRSGAAVFVGLWVLGILQSGPWRILGPDLGGEILPTARAWFTGRLVLFQAVLLGTHLLAGVLWGVTVQNAWAFLSGFWPRLKAERLKSWVVAGATGALTLWAHGLLLARDLGRHPALYQETFLDRGGFPGWVQELAAVRAPRVCGALALVFAGTLVLLAGLRLIQRLYSWFLAFSRPTRVAIGVLGSALVLFGAGLRFVVWTQTGRNAGPNLLLISVDGLRAESLKAPDGPDPSPLGRMVRSARVLTRTVPPSTDLVPSLATVLTGRSPLTHGLRHDFPAAQDVAGPLGSLPAFLRENGWWTEFRADGPCGFLGRMAEEFDNARVPASGLWPRLAGRWVERSPHLLPYLSGRLGRRFPFLLGSPLFADSDLLSEEVGGVIESLASKKKFFLWVHFSSPGPLTAVVSPRAAFRLRPGVPGFFRRPGDGRLDRPLTEAEWKTVRRLYEANVAVLDESIARLLQSLADRRLDQTTAVILWSARALPLTAAEEADAWSLKGPALFGAPFLAEDTALRRGGRRTVRLGRAVDVAPTAAFLLDLPAPSGWEGIPLLRGLPAGEPGIVYAETPTPFLASALSTPTRPDTFPPPLVDLLVEDREAPGHLRLDPAWEDGALVFRDRLMQMGDERILYHPGPNRVSFEYFQLNLDPEARRNLAGTPLGRARVRELREVLFRHLNRESGWRPQNDYWIPEAFLRERREAVDEER